MKRAEGEKIKDVSKKHKIFLFKFDISLGQIEYLYNNCFDQTTLSFRGNTTLLNMYKRYNNSCEVFEKKITEKKRMFVPKLPNQICAYQIRSLKFI